MFSRVIAHSARALKPAEALRICISPSTRLFHASQQCPVPVPRLPETGGKVRYGIIPEEFFQYLYPITGVTGPYVLGLGLMTMLLSKEYYIINSETMSAIGTLGFIVYGVKKYGHKVADFVDATNDKIIADFTEAKESRITHLQNHIDAEKEEQWRVDGKKFIFSAKKNNVAMILESNIRERQLMVFNEVKRRLDYHVELEKLKRRLEQEHLIKWVESNVVKTITPQQEKESISMCIMQLKSLAQRSRATV
uniref:ATP synthase F(0) complex subunit B1, mitochondrial isoform X2 n=1 Tax=Myxine glutinosa TaxID=7769 RepID=UPI00358F571F